MPHRPTRCAKVDAWKFHVMLVWLFGPAV